MATRWTSKTGSTTQQQQQQRQRQQIQQQYQHQYQEQQKGEQQHELQTPLEEFYTCEASMFDTGEQTGCDSIGLPRTTTSPLYSRWPAPQPSYPDGEIEFLEKTLKEMDAAQQQQQQQQQQEMLPSLQASRPRCWDHGCDGKEFASRSNLVRHQKEKRNATAEFWCPLCSAVFRRSSTRNIHLAKQSCHRIRRYSNGRPRPSKLALMNNPELTCVLATGGFPLDDAIAGGSGSVDGSVAVQDQGGEPLDLQMDWIGQPLSLQSSEGGGWVV